MATLDTKIQLYLKENSKIYLDELNNFVLQNNSDGAGDFIASWNVSGLAKPTNEQLSAVTSQAQTMEDNHVVRKTRKKAYGDIGDQLDEIFKDIDAWKTRIQAIKNSNLKS
jgi:hypothetical protein